MILIILIPVTIIVTAISFKLIERVTDDETNHPGISIVCAVLTFLLTCTGYAFIIMFTVSIICAKIDYIAANKRIEVEEKRKAIVSCIELDNANTVTLSSDIADFNNEVLLNRRYLSNFWLKDCTYDFYNEIEPIDIDAIITEKTPTV